MNHEQELPADLDNLIAGLRIENINLKLEIKQKDRALAGMLFAFDDGVGEEWSAPVLDFARKLVKAKEFDASQQGERNQCDGCQAGIPLVDGAHRMGRQGGYPDLMSCQKERYKHPEQAEDDIKKLIVLLRHGDAMPGEQDLAADHLERLLKAEQAEGAQGDACDWLENLEGDAWSDACEEIAAAVHGQPEPTTQEQESLSVRFVNAVKQLCKDFSDLQNRPYMGDVYSALDGLLEHEQIPVAQAGQVPDGWRVMRCTSYAPRDGDKWEIYDPQGSGGVVSVHDVKDWAVRGLLDALAATPAQGGE